MNADLCRTTPKVRQLGHYDPWPFRMRDGFSLREGLDSLAPKQGQEVAPAPPAP